MALEGRRVLFISYNGMLDPLGQSQVIPYLRELSKHGARFTLLSFERPHALKAQGLARCEALRQELAAENIEWHWMRYHQNPSVPATVYDVLAGTRCAIKLVKKNQIEMVHARSHIPATIALPLKRRFGVKMIFDLRGLMADEYVDAEHWRENSVPYRITKSVERRALAAADGIVTLTEKIWPIIKDWEGLRNHEVVHEVVPCCADLDLFKFSEQARQTKRMELGLSADCRVLVYSGSIGGWYLTDKMADLFAQITSTRSSWHFLWLTTGPTELITKLMSDRRLSTDQYTIERVAPAEVPSYLAAADAAIAFYKPALSRLATSPVKVTEYLACGLPIIINAGIGDSDALVTQEKVGALVGDFEVSDYAKALTLIEGLVREAEQTRRKAREVAERLFDLRTVGIERYARLYEKVLGAS